MTFRVVWGSLLCSFVFQASGFSPYFHYGPHLLKKNDADDYCVSVGMKMVKIDMQALNTMTADFILANTNTDDAWLALDCSIHPCRWDENAVDVGWSVWGNNLEPIYPCVSIVIFDQANLMKWKSVPCTTLLRPLCYAPPKPNYEIVYGAFNFVQASTECLNMGGQLAVLTDPVSIAISKIVLNSYMPGGFVWIGLYGNGSSLRWQNKDMGLGVTEWSPGYMAPNPTDDVAIVLDPIDGSWIARPKYEVHPNALCQYNYMPVDIQVDYVTALKGCEQYALDLALLHSQEEVQVASTAISYQGIGYIEDFWIGLTSSDGISFRWNDGRDLTFNAWLSSTPKTPLTTYPMVVLDYLTHAEFDNRKPLDLYSYLCQYPTDNDYPLSQQIVEDFSSATVSSTFPLTTTISSTLPSTTTISSTFPLTTTISSTFPSTTTISSTFESTTNAGISTSLPTTFGNGTFGQRLFKLDRTDSVPNDTPYHVIPGCSKTFCASFCLSEASTCSVFVYNQGKCSLFATYNIGSVVTNIGSNIYA